MSATTARRPLPAAAFLLVLFVLTAIVWWRVLHRPDASSSTSPAPTSVAPVTCSSGKKTASLPAPSAVAVQVLNGAGRDLLATQVTTQLKARGFRTGTPDTAPSEITGTAQIQFGVSGKAAATLLSYYVPGAKLVPVSRTGTALTLVLGTGYRALAAQTTVNQALAKLHAAC